MKLLRTQDTEDEGSCVSFGATDNELTKFINAQKVLNQHEYPREVSFGQINIKKRKLRQPS